MKDFRHLLVIERETGVCIFETQFKRRSSDDLDPDLLGGFLLALFELSKEMNAGGIEHVQLGNVKIVYNIQPELMVVAIVEPGAKNDEIRDTVNLIQRRFREKYGDALASFSGNVTPFEGFTEDLGEIGVERELGLSPRYRLLSSPIQAFKDFGEKGAKVIGKIHERFQDRVKKFREIRELLAGNSDRKRRDRVKGGVQRGVRGRSPRGDSSSK
ncbi:MAG: hypothetical protein ACTSU5_07830 [Promethearchaeota archaeon]